MTGAKAPAGKGFARVLRSTLLFVLIVALALAFRNRGAESLAFTFPYFSGAANIEGLYDWRISPSDYQRVKDFPDQQYLAYRHQRTADFHLNTYNNYGYVVVVLAARTLFWWMGDGNAVVTLQIIVHAAICLAILTLLSTQVRRLSFVLLYALNPLVLHFVTFPFYYFWAVLPCFVFAYLALGGARGRRWILPGVMLLFLGFLIRPATLFVCLATFALLLWQGRRLTAAIAFCAFALLQFQAIGHFYTSPWHTAYIGVGAYPNPYGIKGPVDSAGLDFYLKTTGKQVSNDPITGTFQDLQERDNYWRVLRTRYFEILAESPFLIARNAALNMAQSFGVGYDVGRPWVAFPSTIIGVVMIGLIILSRQWIWGTAILAYAAAFAGYFPPIPAYLFGAYLFIALAGGGIIEDLWRRSVQCRATMRSGSIRVAE
jgi:hypothetical protein